MNDAAKIGIAVAVGLGLFGVAYLIYRASVGGAVGVSSAKVLQVAPGGNALTTAVAMLPVISNTATSLAQLGAATGVFRASSSGSSSPTGSSDDSSADDAGDDSVSEGD